MRQHRRNHCWNFLRDRYRGGVALLAYLSVTFGMPVSVGPRGDAGRPASCQDHVCGCDAADSLRQQCCCFGPREEREAAPVRGGTDSCCAHGQTADARTGCAEPAANEVPSNWRWAIGMSAQRCKGLSTLWLSTAAVLPQPEIFAWRPNWECPQWLPLSEEVAARRPSCPPVPPPRSHLA